MSHLGIVFVSMNRAQANDIVLSGSFKSQLVELTGGTLEENRADGFHFGTDFDAVANGHFGHGIVLRMHLDDVLGLIDTVSAEHSDNSGYDRFAVGDAAFEAPVSVLTYVDGAMSEFSRLVDLDGENDIAIDTNPTEEQLIAALDAADQVEAPAKTYATPYLTCGQWFKKMREEGLIASREKKATAPNTDKSARSPAQIAAIRGFYARRKAA